MNIKTIKTQIVPIFKKHGVIKASLFGSLVRGEMNTKSDIDVLIKLPNTSSLFDLIDIKNDLEEKLCKKVDLVEYDSIKPTLKKYIMPEQVVIYTQQS